MLIGAGEEERSRKIPRQVEGIMRDDWSGRKEGARGSVWPD
jgi:hypothetical protein